MKLSQWDFRPGPPKKKNLKKWLLILPMVLIAGYWFYSSFSNSEIELSIFLDTVQDTSIIEQKKEPPVVNEKRSCGFKWGELINHVTYRCELINSEFCDKCLDNIDQNLTLPFRNWINRHLLPLMNIEANVYTVEIFLDSIEKKITLKKFILHSASKDFVFQSQKEGGITFDLSNNKSSGKLCSKKGNCIPNYKLKPIESDFVRDIQKQIKDNPEMVQVSNWPIFEVNFNFQQTLQVTPFWKGKVVQIINSEEIGQSVKVFHGKGLYVIYRNLGEIESKLMLGNFITVNDVIGFTGPLGTQPSFSVSMEKNGMFRANFNSFPFLVKGQEKS